VSESNEIGSVLESDDSWDSAFATAHACLDVPTNLSALIRNSWSGIWDTRDFMRNLGFIVMNPKCLLRAADIQVTEGEVGNAQDVDRAVQLLGVRSSVVVVAINYVCQTVLDKNPPDRLWSGIFREMMNLIEIGYKFGGRADGIGTEGGMLMGFARSIGLAILLAQYPKEFGEWFSKTRGVDNPQFVRNAFGCESYQVGAAAIQQLGFGSDIAIASALAVGHLNHDLIEVPKHILHWKAAYLWIECLRNGQSYPADAGSRYCFNGLTPPSFGQPCPPALSTLYSQVAQVRRQQSSWMWHLPVSSYEETTKILIERRKQANYKTSRGTMSVEQR
jgi:hypothetical protein